jgi:hypothetical protein
MPPAAYPCLRQQRTNGLAIAGLVLGILWLYWIGSVLALILRLRLEGPDRQLGRDTVGPGDGDRGDRSRLGRRRHVRAEVILIIIGALAAPPGG